MAIRLETDLYQPVKRLLESQGYTVRGEVGDCDLMAVRGEEPPVIVELKRGFCLTLVYQGIERQRITDAVYLAVAAPQGRAARRAWDRGFPDMIGLCRRLGLGLISVQGRAGMAEVHLDPAPYRPRKDAARRTRLLGEFTRRVGDHNTGGSTRRPVVTAYRQDALRCADRLAAHGKLKPAELRRLTGVKTAGTILQRNVYGWFERVERGVYTLTPQGLAALDLFADAVRTIRAADSNAEVPQKSFANGAVG